MEDLGDFLMDFDIDDFEPCSSSFKLDESIGNKFYHVKDINQEYYTPFLKKGAVYKPIKADGTKPDAKEWAEFFNRTNKTGEDSYTDIGVSYSYTDPEQKFLAEVPGGVYSYESAVGSQSLPERLQVFDFLTGTKEKILPLGATFAEVKEALNKFLSKEDVYKQVETKYKLGLLLYGTPGQGKSVFIRALLKDLIGEEQDAVVIYMSGAVPSPNFLRKINTALKDRLKVFIFEELTANLTSHYVSWLLTFLDGENSIDRSITIATTNYPEALPENVVNRPSRFDKIYEFLPPDEKDRRELIKLYANHEATEEEVQVTKGYSIADIKELCISIRVNDLTLGQAVEVIKKRKTKCKNAFQKARENSIGW